jgi:hypothetical protein
MIPIFPVTHSSTSRGSLGGPPRTNQAEKPTRRTRKATGPTEADSSGALRELLAMDMSVLLAQCIWQIYLEDR